MRKLIVTILLFAVAMFAYGCSEEQKTVSQYGKTVTQSYGKAQNAAKGANLSAGKRAVDSYRAANGKLPANLAEITSFSGIPLSEAEYNYNPANGKLTLK